MKIEFNNNTNDEIHQVCRIQEGSYEDMLKVREEQTKKAQELIQRMFKDYNGQSVCIMIQHEDENGMPDHVEMLMAGVASLESQISMAKALTKGSESVVEAILESCKGNPKMMSVVATKLMKLMKEK